MKKAEEIRKDQRILEQSIKDALLKFYKNVGVLEVSICVNNTFQELSDTRELVQVEVKTHLTL